MIWLGNIYFHNLVEKRGGTFSRALFKKQEFFKNQTFLKDSLFFVSEHGNLTGVKTYCDRLGSLGKTFLNRKIKFFGLERD